MISRKNNHGSVQIIWQFLMSEEIFSNYFSTSEAGILTHMQRWWLCSTLICWFFFSYMLNHFNGNKQNNLMNYSYFCRSRSQTWHGLVYWFERCWLRKPYNLCHLLRAWEREKERRKNYKKAHVLVLRQPKGILRRAHRSLIELVLISIVNNLLACIGQSWPRCTDNFNVEKLESTRF